MDETAAKARLDRSGKHSPLQKLEAEVAELAQKKRRRDSWAKFEEAARLRKKNKPNATNLKTTPKSRKSKPNENLLRRLRMKISQKWYRNGLEFH